MESVKKYLADINLYSQKKFSNCSKKCSGDETSLNYNECIW